MEIHIGVHVAATEISIPLLKVVLDARTASAYVWQPTSSALHGFSHTEALSLSSRKLFLLSRKTLAHPVTTAISAEGRISISIALVSPLYLVEEIVFPC